MNHTKPRTGHTVHITPRTTPLIGAPAEDITYGTVIKGRTEPMTGVRYLHVLHPVHGIREVIADRCTVVHES